MIAKAQQWLTIKQYCHQHYTTRNTVMTWLREGKLPSKWTKDGHYYKRRLVLDVKPKHLGLGDQRVCSVCLRALALENFYINNRGSPRSICKQCYKEREAVKRHAERGELAEVMSIEHDWEISKHVAMLPPEALAERDQRIQAHTARVAAMGLQGNGEDWDD